MRRRAEGYRGHGSARRPVFLLARGRIRQDLHRNGTSKTRIRARLSGVQRTAAFLGARVHFAGEKLRHRRSWLRGRYESGKNLRSPHCKNSADENLRARYQGHACGGAGRRALLCVRSEEHTSELQSQFHLVCRLLLEKKKKTYVAGKLHTD